MKEEEKVIKTSTVVNEDIVKTEDENTVIDDNTTTEDSDVDDVTTPVDEPVVSTEDQTLAPTDDVIPTPVDPVVTPVEDETLAPTDDVIQPGEDPVVSDPGVYAPDDVSIETTVTDVPSDVPVEVPGSEVTDIPADPAPVVSDVVPEVGVENPAPVVDEPVTDTCDTAGCENTSTDITTCPGENVVCPSANVTVANIFGTLQESISIVWRFHLKTKIYRFHEALGEFYHRALYIVDNIIEQYQGVCGVVEDPFTNCVVGDGKSEGEYLTELKAFISNNRLVLTGCNPELNSTIDEFLCLIDITNGKLATFTESAVKSFAEFCYEDYQYIKESCHYDRYGERHSDDPDDPDYDDGESCCEEE